MRAFVSLLPFLPALAVSCMQHTDSRPQSDSVSRKAIIDSFPLSTLVSETHYSVFYANGKHFSIASQRPMPEQQEIYLCIAGAFTQLDDNKIDGLFIENGQVIRKNVNHHLGGGLLISGNDVSIVRTFDGNRLTKQWIDSVAALKGSFFQQIQLVRNDSALRFGKDQKLFQRRAIVLFKNGEAAVVESQEAILLQTFADDLVRLGARDALYTDMGSWDEGWYRAADGRVKVIGKLRGDTDRQSNWVVLAR